MRRFSLLQRTQNCTPPLNINCVDPLGRTALLMAIDNENLEMVELLIENKVRYTYPRGVCVGQRSDVAPNVCRSEVSGRVCVERAMVIGQPGRSGDHLWRG